MSVWELRQWIESQLPWWLPFAIVLVALTLAFFKVWHDDR